MTEDIRWEQRFSNSETAQIIAEAIINEYFELF
ncbi:hypothetical protein SAMN00777080_0452 [Aquiflexum balticum DSM 16537]|uniref:Uncharacterized protein n=1 Tax=Aquiflexum balticum DSM 16537 TaxID=758820 RepID=A0A1W2GZW5_9BACT|nr:hypothetical protein SAMN00777080_0452 [Aquiflexum balticum DSM 16537]